MTELSKRDIESLAESNVGLLKEVQEATCLLLAIAPAVMRARNACKIGASNEAAKCRVVDDRESDVTAGKMFDAQNIFQHISAYTEELARYI